MSGAETARRRVVQRRIGGAEMALPHLYYEWLEQETFPLVPTASFFTGKKIWWELSGMGVVRLGIVLARNFSKW